MSMNDVGVWFERRMLVVSGEGPGVVLTHCKKGISYSGQLRIGNFFARAPLIKTVMRLFTAASNHSQLWLLSIDYDSHE